MITSNLNMALIISITVITRTSLATIGLNNDTQTSDLTCTRVSHYITLTNADFGFSIPNCLGLCLRIGLVQPHRSSFCPQWIHCGALRRKITHLLAPLRTDA